MSAGRWLAGRLTGGLVTVAAVVTITFVLLHAAPGAPFAGTGDERVPQAVTERLRQDFGLDRPVPVQYARWLWRTARGDLGVSFTQRRPVTAVLGDTLPNTLLLAGAGLMLMFALGIGIALAQARWPDGTLDRTLSAVSLILFSTPVFWLGAMLLTVFAVGTGWFPVGGARDLVLPADAAWTARAADRLHHLVLPALTLGLAGAGLVARYQRTALFEVVRHDFIRTARAKGLGPTRVLWRHALPNALLPTITQFGLLLPAVLSGTVLVETVFGWPGMGKLTADAILQRDYPVVAGAALVASVLVVLGSLLADALTWLADPRTRRPA